MGRPLGSENKDKPFREALRMAIADADGDAKVLRKIAEALVANAMGGDNVAIKEVADRLDGKVPQGLAGPDGTGPIQTVFQIITGVPRNDAGSDGS